MEKEHREPWEVLSLMVAGYLALLWWHYLITIMDNAMAFVKYEGQLNLGDCVEIPLLL